AGRLVVLVLDRTGWRRLQLQVRHLALEKPHARFQMPVAPHQGAFRRPSFLTRAVDACSLPDEVRVLPLPVQLGFQLRDAAIAVRFIDSTGRLECLGVLSAPFEVKQMQSPAAEAAQDQRDKHLYPVLRHQPRHAALLSPDVQREAYSSEAVWGD